jgi:putative DNA primase/helicase
MTADAFRDAAMSGADFLTRYGNPGGGAKPRLGGAITSLRDDLNRGQQAGELVKSRLLLDRKDPLRTARLFVQTYYQSGEARTLHHHCGAFYVWTGSHYSEASDAEIRAKMYELLDGADCRGKDGRPEPFRPNAARVNDALDALRAVTILSDREAAPCWLDGREGPDAGDMIACANGLLHLPTKELHKPTPHFYGHHAVEFGYDQAAPAPEQWLAFLADLWGDDHEVIGTLQELFGYLLTSDTRQQKVFLLVGPKRSGKGTIARILKALLGNANVAGPTLSGIGMNFGLAPLIGKPLAVISDARLSGRTDQHIIAERLLSISGEDHITIDRKHRMAWTGMLPTRFLILTNELPRIADASGALASRFIVLTLSASFYGREDHGLTERLLTELPGILNWALAGLERLRERGHFNQPASSAEAIEELEDLGSPVKAFVRERCEIGPDEKINCQLLFGAWQTWCEMQSRREPGTVQTFGRDLRAAVPGLKTERPSDGEGGKLPRRYLGISLG